MIFPLLILAVFANGASSYALDVKIRLQPGWNFLGSPYSGATVPEDECSLFSWTKTNPGDWKFRAQRQEWRDHLFTERFQRFTNTEPGQPLWVYASDPCTLSLSGSPLNTNEISFTGDPTENFFYGSNPLQSLDICEQDLSALNSFFVYRNGKFQDLLKESCPRILSTGEGFITGWASSSRTLVLRLQKNPPRGIALYTSPELFLKTKSLGEFNYDTGPAFPSIEQAQNRMTLVLNQLRENGLSTIIHLPLDPVRKTIYFQDQAFDPQNFSGLQEAYLLNLAHKTKETGMQSGIDLRPLQWLRENQSRYFGSIQLTVPSSTAFQSRISSLLQTTSYDFVLSDSTLESSSPVCLRTDLPCLKVSPGSLDHISSSIRSLNGNTSTFPGPNLGSLSSSPKGTYSIEFQFMDETSSPLNQANLLLLSAIENPGMYALFPDLSTNAQAVVSNLLNLDFSHVDSISRHLLSKTSSSSDTANLVILGDDLSSPAIGFAFEILSQTDKKISLTQNGIQENSGEYYFIIQDSTRLSPVLSLVTSNLPLSFHFTHKCLSSPLNSQYQQALGLSNAGPYPRVDCGESTDPSQYTTEMGCFSLPLDSAWSSVNLPGLTSPILYLRSNQRILSGMTPDLNRLRQVKGSFLGFDIPANIHGNWNLEVFFSQSSLKSVSIPLVNALGMIRVQKFSSSTNKEILTEAINSKIFLQTKEGEVYSILENRAPTVSIGNSRLVSPFEFILLNASALDLDQDRLSNLWKQLSGPALSLNGSDTIQCSFSMPQKTIVTQVFELQFQASDMKATSKSKVLTLTLPANHIPQIQVTVPSIVSPQSSVEMIATVTDADGEPLSTSFTQISGPDVDLQNANTLTASFIAPAKTNSLQTMLFEAQVNDGVSSSSPVTLQVQVLANSIPKIFISTYPELIVAEKSSIFIVSSSDSDGEPRTYHWRQVEDGTPRATLDLSNPERVGFTSPATEEDVTLTFGVFVSDGIGNSAEKTFQVQVFPRKCVIIGGIESCNF